MTSRYSKFIFSAAFCLSVLACKPRSYNNQDADDQSVKVQWQDPDTTVSEQKRVGGFPLPKWVPNSTISKTIAGKKWKRFVWAYGIVDPSSISALASRSKEIQYGDVTFLCAYQSAPLPNNAPEETADMVKYLQKSMSAVSEPMRIGTLMKIRDESKESVKYSLHGALIALALAPDASKSVLESVNNLKNSMIELKFTDGLSEEVVQAVRKAGDNSHAGSLIAVSQVDFGKLKSPYTIVTSLATSANYYPYNDQIYMVKDRKFSEAEFAKAQYRGPKCDDMKAAMIRDVR